MARALVLTHAPAEGPGTLAQWLPEVGLDLDVVDLWRGDTIAVPFSHDALVVLGGPQQAYDDSSAPWLATTKRLLADAVGLGRPVLGICLGAQLLAVATGGTVAPGARGPELGARLVARRDAAADDPVFAAVPFTPAVVQWHWDAITELPPGALLLASSTRYPHQAFRVGACGYGLQFHIETPAAMVQEWVESDSAGVLAAGLDPTVLLAQAVAELPAVVEVWRPAVKRWAALAVRNPNGPDGG